MARTMTRTLDFNSVNFPVRTDRKVPLREMRNYGAPSQTMALSKRQNH
jgi:hypothetical protein